MQTVVVNDRTSITVLRTWADQASRFADVLGRQEPSLGSENFSLAGGRAVLCGPEMYVNRAIAAGFDGALSESDWRHFEARCHAVGVPPAFEVSPATAANVRTQLSPDGTSERNLISHGFQRRFLLETHAATGSLQRETTAG